MIKISLDESYVFDLLSIYEVKIESSTDDIKKNKLIESYKTLKLEIIESIGVNLFDSIISSNEYAKLKSSNKYVFDLVDRADETELSKETASANYTRYLHKINLQRLYFETELTEVKL
jgi:hypothetical protein